MMLWHQLKSRSLRTVIIISLGAAATALGDTRASDTEGLIGGRVALPRVRANQEERPSVASLGGSTSRPAEARPAVVYLDTVPRGAFEPDDPQRVTMKQQGQAFVPHVLAVTVGTIVDFPNADLTFHNVFSLSKAKPFDLGRYARGVSKSVRFDRPGVVQVYCDIHSHMRAFVVVFAHRFFAVTDASGRYAISRVPPGTYTLAVWYEGDVRESLSVVVPESGADVTADFVIR